LHNANEIGRLDLHYHDYVYVEKGGEIIPKITGVDPGSAQTWCRESVKLYLLIVLICGTAIG
jgi:NAD-dependent DNA ligase